MAYQLSIFLENKPGKLEKITKILADNKINIRGISLANAGDFGIAKIIADNPDLAYKVLRENHFTVSKNTILAVRIEDRAGSLHDFLNVLSRNNINIEECYGVSIAYNKSAAIIIEIEKFPDAEKILRENNIYILTDNEVYSL